MLLIDLGALTLEVLELLLAEQFMKSSNNDINVFTEDSPRDMLLVLYNLILKTTL